MPHSTPRGKPGKQAYSPPSEPPLPIAGTAGDPVAWMFAQLDRMQQSIDRLALRLSDFESPDPIEAEPGAQSFRVTRTCLCCDSPFSADPGSSEMLCEECCAPASPSSGDPTPF